jgi:hypothetical protein
MRSIALIFILITAVQVISTPVTRVDTSAQVSGFARFKREMMPKVDKRVKVVGTLESAKLGWLVTFKEYGVYIYAVKDSDIAKMNDLNRFHGHTVEAVGTLRYSKGSDSDRSDVASVPEHFFFDVAEVKVISVKPPPSTRLGGR